MSQSICPDVIVSYKLISYYWLNIIIYEDHTLWVFELIDLQTVESFFMIFRSTNSTIVVLTCDVMDDGCLQVLGLYYRHCWCYVFLLLAWFYYLWANPWHILTSHFILWRVLSHKKVLLLSFCESIAQHFLKVFKKQTILPSKNICNTQKLWKRYEKTVHANTVLN